MATSLKRSLNLTQLCFYGIGSMIGAGIYSVVGVAAGEAGANLWISFLLAGTAGFFTVLSYAELSSIFPRAGAEYQFLKKSIPEWRIFAYMAGFLIALNATATSATVALAFAGYLNVFVSVPILVAAFCLLVLCTLANLAGIRESTWVGITLICIEIAGLALIIFTGAESGEMTKSFAKMPEWENAAGIFAATALVFFVYIGFEDVANLSEETKEPKKTIPRALIISVIVTSILYFLVALSVTALAAPEQLANSTSPLTEAASKSDPWRGQALGIAALFATASTALISLVSISRMLFAMAREGDMPKPLASVWSKRKTPWAAGLTLFTAASLFLLLKEVKIVASVSSFGVLLVFISVQTALIILRYRKPNLKRPFRVPLSIGKLPILPVIGITIACGLLTQFEPLVYLVGSGAIIFGICVYFIIRKTN